jgi:DNA-binding transcriptional ArsR family regulator
MQPPCARYRDASTNARRPPGLRVDAVLNRPPATALTGKCLLAYHQAVGDVFKALADPTRRAILDELQERNGQTLFEICARLTMKHGLGSTRQAVSQHLEVLESAGLVSTRREGRYKFHELDTSPLQEISARWPPAVRRPK